MTLDCLLPLFSEICFRPTSIVGFLNFVIGLAL
jgi:hypothetical protein